VSRIFLTLSGLANAGLLWSAGLGLAIGDAAKDGSAVGWHMLVAIFFGAIAAMLVHAIALTYFMGTGRWIEETSEAYKLPGEARRENIKLKYRVIPWMVGCILLILGTGSLGAIADPASNMEFQSAPTVHMTLAMLTVVVNITASFVEWSCIRANGQLVDAVVEEVGRIRRERGLDPEPVVAGAETGRC